MLSEDRERWRLEGERGSSVTAEEDGRGPVMGREEAMNPNTASARVFATAHTNSNVKPHVRSTKREPWKQSNPPAELVVPTLLKP